MDNVVKFPTKPAVFSQNLRQKLEVGITPYTEKPTETIREVEHIICSYIVAGVRELMTRFGENLGRKMAEKVSNG